MINRYEVTVESCGSSHSHAWLSLGRARIAARRWDGIRQGMKLAVRIPPDDVLLCCNHPGRISARNVLPGHVRSLRRTPEGVYVALDVGFPMTAMVTRGAAEDLGLRRGSPLFAIVKAIAVIPDLDVRPGFRLALAGQRGGIDPERFDFLKAVGRAGSLSEAARELGISYRTAWMWARALNRAWGSRLIARIHGGAGGGGTSITAAGRAVLDRAMAIEREILAAAGRRSRNASGLPSNRTNSRRRAHSGRKEQ